jgi:hypothetical protein
LNKIVEGLEMQSDDALSFYDRETGEVETVSKDLLGEAEDYRTDEMPDIPEWQEDEWETVKRIVAKESFVRLPTKFDIHEWQILSDFSNEVESEEIRAELLDAIHGAGAFRSFKAAVRRRGIEDEWYKFRAEALRQIAIDWCEEHDIAWV